MKKLIIGILSSALILGACSHHSDNNDTSINHSDSTKENTESSTQENKNNYKEVAVSDFFNDRKEHLVYRLEAINTGDALVSNLEEDANKAIKEDYDLEGIYNVQGNKGFEYVFDTDPGSYDNPVPDSITLNKLSGNSMDENKRKFEKLQNINLKSYNDKFDQNLQLHNKPGKIKKLLYTNKNNIVSEDFDIPVYHPVSKSDVIDDDDTEVWKPTKSNTLFDVTHGDTSSPKDKRDKLISINPFSINGKTYAGLATSYSMLSGDDANDYDTMIITEVPKNTKIVMDKDTSDGKILKYENTKEGKDEQESEKRDFDNL